MELEAAQPETPEVTSWEQLQLGYTCGNQQLTVQVWVSVIPSQQVEFGVSRMPTQLLFPGLNSGVMSPHYLQHRGESLALPAFAT